MMDNKAKVYASGDAVVEALADRSINAFSATVSVAGATVGAAVNANIVIAGAAMNEDAHKVIALDGGDNDTTPIQTFIDNAFGDKYTKKYIESEKPDTDLSETYKSDGTSAGSDANLGKNDKGEYDGSNYSKDLAANDGEASSKGLSSDQAAKNIDGNVEELICTGQRLTECYLVNCPNLSRLDVSNNQLAKMRLCQSMPRLRDIDIRTNILPIETIGKMLLSLCQLSPENLFDTAPQILTDSNITGELSWQAKQKGWIIKNV